jgi:hypothetical protein
MRAVLAAKCVEDSPHTPAALESRRNFLRDRLETLALIFTFAWLRT